MQAPPTSLLNAKCDIENAVRVLMTRLIIIGVLPTTVFYKFLYCFKLLLEIRQCLLNLKCYKVGIGFRDNTVTMLVLHVYLCHLWSSDCLIIIALQ